VKTILITGATNGIGLEASVTLAKEGHRVVLVGRDEKRTAEAVAQVKQRSGSEKVESLLADFMSLADVRKLADDYRAKYDRLDVLINNAGTVFSTRTLSKDGIEATFAVNHLAPYLLTRLLLDLIVKSAPARVVNVSSENHYTGTMDFDDLGFEKGYFIMKAYGRSKLGNVLFTRSLAKQLESRAVTVNAVHPGGVRTNIWSHAPWFAKPVLRLMQLLLITAEEGSRTLTYLATNPEVEGKTGLYFEKNRPVEPGKLAQDDALAQRLWAESARLVGLAS
jgi:NAD(P)-dependent dehydrogenase (short-subunit alcohol dehydrogenase family)